MNKEEFYQKIQKMDFISRNSIYGTGKDIPIKKIEQDIGIILYSPVMFMLPKYGVAEDILAIKIIQHQSDLKSNTISFLIHYNNADAESFTNKVIDGILNNFTIFICKFDNELNHMSTILCTTGKALKVLPVSVDEIKYHHVTFECHAFTNISGTIKGKQMANLLKSTAKKERGLLINNE